MSSMTAYADGTPQGFVRVDVLATDILARKYFPREIRYKVGSLIEFFDFDPESWRVRTDLRVQYVRGRNGSYHYIVPYDRLSFRKLQNVLSRFDPDKILEDALGHRPDANKHTYPLKENRNVQVAHKERTKKGPRKSRIPVIRMPADPGYFIPLSFQRDAELTPRRSIGTDLWGRPEYR